MKSKIQIIYIFITLLLCVDILAYYLEKISLIGYFSDVLLFWIWLGLTMAVIVIFWKKILAKIMLAILILGLICSILPMMLPFYTVMLSMSSYGLRMKKDLNEKYRAQIVGYSVLSSPWLEIIEKRGIIEKRVFSCTDNSINGETELKIGSAKDIIFNSESDKTLLITLFYGDKNKTITFDKTTGKIIL
ncbi:hypothetical protein BWD42_00680 [Sphingobacterium sp. CZ-UAM]|uniref:hypothetical protein n=1 Tax=Sphingobacterium sp. CZ-UAM TaxID=1933868 RepID=UPI000985A812|nr:hypothetical protein [Sphingobacterium sp. CZ-UAM]OOG18536.1 hypothetical protein BWD42_00680 [Sphingobacterium sp. CZ-UAM]